MNKQIERILICVLWLLAATLGTNFWLNTSYGFNIFSAQHWQYLAYLQAAQTPVRPAFYISLTFAILLSLGVLYVLIRPKGVLRRRIGIGIGRARRTNMPATDTTYAPAAAMPPAAANTAAVRPTAPQMQRPPRITPSLAKPMQNQTTAQSTPVQAPAAVINFDALRNIFEDTDYSVKRSPQIGNFKPAVFAIGTSEVLWLGGIGISQAPLSEAIDRLKTIFSDTLDDIEINISGFIIAPTGDVSDPSILSFPDTDALREYMQSHKNPPPEDADGRENFNAYSEYIDTVINYMDKT